VPEMEAVNDQILVRLPEVNGDAPDQDAEWCEVKVDGELQRLRFHDYAEIFSIPGLYEQLFYEKLECASPETVRGLLEDVLEERRTPPGDLVVLDVGAGNGMVAEELSDLGAGSIVGVDILEEAASAAERDRPGVYDDYRVVDLTDPPLHDDAALAAAGFNCLTSVAALGFGDIPPAAFAQAFDYVEDGGLVAFTIKERFVQPREDESGFSRLIRRMHEQDMMQTLVEHRYRHRFSVSGEPLHYLAYVAEKQSADSASELLPETLV